MEKVITCPLKSIFPFFFSNETAGFSPWHQLEVFLLDSVVTQHGQLTKVFWLLDVNGSDACKLCSVSLRQWFSQGAILHAAPPPSYLAMSGNIFDWCNLEGSDMGIQGVTARDSAKHPTMYRTALNSEDFSGPKCL